MLKTFGFLATNVFRPHVDGAREAKVGAGSGRCHAVLPGPGLGDHPRLAHPQGQQRLPERVVDFVRPRVIEVLAFQPNLGTATRLA